MYVQVKATCMKKKHPPTYAEFLFTRNHKTETVNQYLSNINLLNEGQIEEVLPPADYFKAVSEEFENLGIKEKLNTFEESGIKEKLSQNEEFLICFSPDLDEDSIPTIQEIFNDLKQLKEKYENEMVLAMTKICSLNDDYKKKQKFTADEKFEPQCPIF